MGRFSLVEILLIAGVVILLFGPKRLPELAKAFGKSITEFKRGMSSLTDDVKTDTKDNPPKA